MTPTQTDQFLAWARAALSNYPLHEPSLRFLGHSDNITFRVEEPGGALYLLRLHQPVINYWAGIRQLPEFITSELTWLETLAWEGGFPVQHPIHTQAGQLVSTVTIENGTSIPATLLTWLDGEHFSPASPDAVDLVDHFGALVAHLHNFAARWTPPAGFARPTYDEDHFHRIFARLLRGVNLGVFSEETYWILRATCQALLTEIQVLDTSPDQWGMIHADLHVGNFLVNRYVANKIEECDIIPIDFSFCGFGHYLFDLSVCLAGGLNAALRQVFLQGYRSIRPLAESDLRAVDAYALAGMMSYFSYQIDIPAERAWLQRRIPELVQKECRNFLHGERLM